MVLKEDLLTQQTSYGYLNQSFFTAILSVFTETQTKKPTASTTPIDLSFLLVGRKYEFILKTNFTKSLH